MSVSEAAKQLGLSASALKKKYSEFGIKEWPYRRIKRLKQRIEYTQEKLRNCKPHLITKRNLLNSRLQSYGDKMAQIIENPASLEANELSVFNRKRRRAKVEVDVDDADVVPEFRDDIFREPDATVPRSLEHALEEMCFLLYNAAKRNSKLNKRDPLIPTAMRYVSEPQSSTSSTTPALTSPSSLYRVRVDASLSSEDSAPVRVDVPSHRAPVLNDGCRLLQERLSQRRSTPPRKSTLSVLLN